MKKLNLSLTKKNALSKNEMKSISGGYPGCVAYCPGHHPVQVPSCEAPYLPFCLEFVVICEC